MLVVMGLESHHHFNFKFFALSKLCPNQANMLIVESDIKIEVSRFLVMKPSSGCLIGDTSNAS